jgi:pilus assembly protein CpaF
MAGEGGAAATQASERFGTLGDGRSERLGMVSDGRSGVGPAGTVLTDELVSRVQRRLAADRVDPEPAALARALRAEAGGPVSDAAMLRLIRAMQTELVGSGPLAALLEDPLTTDVVVNGPDDVRVDRGRGWEPAPSPFGDEAAVQRLARRLAAAAGQRLDDAHPYVDGRLPDGTRLHAVLAPVAASGTCLSLRVLRPAIHDLAALEAAGSLPGRSRTTIEAVIRSRLALVITGGTGSGKTTLLSAVLSAVTESERIVIAEDAEELRPAHPHVIRLIARAANVEGAGVVPLRELVRQALRMRPDRLVVGEVRGAEVVDLLAALTTGHDGGAGTVHANRAADLPARVEALGALGGLDRAAVHAQLAAAVQVVLHLRRDRGRRVLSEVAVLRHGADGRCQALPAVLDGVPVAPGAELLGGLIRDRGVAVPW